MSTLRVNTIQNVAGSGSPEINGVAKAWVQFNGAGAVSIYKSYNVSSIVDYGTGNYGMVFINPMPDITYACVSNANGEIGVSYSSLTSAGTQTTGSCNVFVVRASSPTTLVDVTAVHAAIFR